MDGDPSSLFAGAGDGETLPPRRPAADAADAPTRMPGARAADPDVTRMPEFTPADPDVTRMPGFTPGDPDVTRMPGFAPGDPDITRMPGLPAGDANDPDLTVMPGARAAASVGDDGPLEIGSAFGARYHIMRLLGIGGMGAVYQAWDAELGVAVAIKVIRPEVMADPGASAEVERRFKRELLLARQVTHKNVVRIHDLGEIGGIKYITMPFVDGSDLSSVLKEAGRLPVPKALRIGRAIVSGLVAAHKAGVVHRDLKPANIMIDPDDDAMIMDFGIALSSGAPTAPLPPTDPRTGFMQSAASYSTTMQGSVVGTVEYMAPEQARGQTVDQRADIYAFGLILYDMVVGRRRAEHAPSAIAELQARMETAPPPPRTIVPQIPEAVDRMIAKCLEPDAAKRFQTSADLAAHLDRLDDQGQPIPISRVVGLRLALPVAALLLAIAGGGTWWYARTLVPPPKHAPVSVVIADMRNGTADPTFDHTLEPVLKRALEGAGFVSAYDRPAVIRTLGVHPPDVLDETAAREVAVKQGVGVVVSGAITRNGSGYDLALKAAQTVTGDVIASVKGRAASKEQVLETATRLVATIRKALGDKTSESAQMFTMASLSATSLDVVHHYGEAMEAQSRNKFEEARQSFLKTVELDPKFGIGYQGLSVISRNLGRLDDADKYIKEALRHVDGMTERERFVTRGMYYRVTGDYPQCVKEYGELISRYAGDAVGRNQRALCLSKLRDLQGAVADMREVVKMLPKRTVFRDNLALYTAYASDFEGAEREALAVEEPDVYAVLPLAFGQLGQGKVADATATYQRLGTMGALGASFSASGLADIGLYQGRLADAAKLFEQGAAADLAANNPSKAATKLAMLAHVHLLLGRKGAAAADADKALAQSKAVPIRFLAAQTYVETGAAAKARALADDLGAELTAEPQAYGRIIEGELALTKDARLAVKRFTEANGMLDTWIGHYDLGRAYLALGMFPQADSEFDRCLKRRGEAISLFMDEEPTYGYFPAVYYYQGRVREGMNSTGFAESYREYLAIRGDSTSDPLLPDVRRRLAK